MAGYNKIKVLCTACYLYAKREREREMISLLFTNKDKWKCLFKASITIWLCDGACWSIAYSGSRRNKSTTSLAHKLFANWFANKVCKLVQIWRITASGSRITANPLYLECLLLDPATLDLTPDPSVRFKGITSIIWHHSFSRLPDDFSTWCATN